MFKILLLFIKHFFLPALFFLWQWKRVYKSKFDGLFMSLMVGVYIFYVYQIGDWYIYGYYFRYLLLGLFAIVLFKTLYNIRNLPFRVRKNPKERFGIYVIGFFTLVVLALGTWAFWGRFIAGDTVALDLPLKDGAFYVVEGGDSPIINNHHHLFPLPEKYSVELVKLDKMGKYAASLFPDELSAFKIYGEKVYSPCNGIVVSVVDSFPDLKPSQLADLKPSQLKDQEDIFWGNAVTIEHEGIQVVLACLKQNSIVVQPGDTIESGDIVAEVGNSEFIWGPFNVTLEPHLHIHASRKSERENFPFDREGVPISFNGQFLIKNMLISVP